MRIIPLTLRITSYSAAPPEWPGRPTIHIEGGLAGQSNDLSDARRVHGKVEMVGNGDIRWSLVSTSPFTSPLFFFRGGCAGRKTSFADGRACAVLGEGGRGRRVAVGGRAAGRARLGDGRDRDVDGRGSRAHGSSG